MCLSGSCRLLTSCLMLKVYSSYRVSTILRPKYNIIKNAHKQLEKKHYMIECQHFHYIAISSSRSAEKARSHILEFTWAEIGR